MPWLIWYTPPEIRVEYLDGFQPLSIWPLHHHPSLGSDSAETRNKMRCDYEVVPAYNPLTIAIFLLLDFTLLLKV